MFTQTTSVLSQETLNTIAYRHRLGANARYFLRRFSREGDRANPDAVLGVGHEELDRLNEAMAEVKELQNG